MKNIQDIQVGQKIYINGQSETEELIVSKIGRLYATFSNAPHRLILSKGVVELKKKGKWDRYVLPFETPEKAENWMKATIEEVFG